MSDKFNHQSHFTNPYPYNGHFRIYSICPWDYRRLLFGALMMLLLSGLLAACTNYQATPQVTSSTIGTSTLIATDLAEVKSAVVPSPTVIATGIPTQLPDTGWISLKTGLERRVINLKNENDVYTENIYLLRIDPDFFRFDVAYQPGSAQRLMDWQSDTDALVVVNGGYFTEANQATGLIVVDGQASGVTYRDFGGMLAIFQDSTELRWLPQIPYNSAEPLLAAMQSFPMLVKPGGLMGSLEEDGLPARRTVLGQDRQGRFVFILATTGTMTLHEMSRYLVESDLNLDLALNLDGGSSTGLLLADPVEGVPPFTHLPAVITVHSKNE